MKKFLLSFVVLCLTTSMFAQTNQCPISFKRNNGNGGGTAGNITFTFATAVNTLLYVSTITEVGTGNTAVITGAPIFKKNNTEVTYGFQSSNLGPAGNLIVNYFIDTDADQVQDPGETGYICNLTPQGPLPVVLANFNAVSKSGKVSLTWETLQEVENDGFEIQRRVGTGKYETVAFVDSKVTGGTGSGTTYSFDDNAPIAKGVTYYRLRQVDLNGQAAFSEVKALRGLGSPIVVSVYPNPSRGTTNVAIPEGTGTMDVTLDDFAGRSVQRWNGLNVRNLQLSNLQPGMYLLRITIRETGEQITERVTVQ